MTFNEFQKQLINRKIDPQVAYMLTVMYEQITHVAQQGGEQSKLLLELANSMQGLVKLSESQIRDIAILKRGGRPDGVEVESVAHDPNDIN